MAGGLASALLVEVEFASGVWTDVTADVALEEEVSVRAGRGGQFDPLQAGELTLTLRNDSGGYTPDNPLSTYWPNVVENKRIRFTVTKSAVNYRRFIGVITSWSPTDLDDGSAAVEVTAVDALGQLGQRVMGMEWVERWGYRAASQTVDVFPLDDEASATGLRNIGNGTGTARVVPSASGAGSSELGAMDQGVLLPGQISLRANGSQVGPVVAVDLGRIAGTNGVISFAFKTASTCTAAVPTLIVAAGYDSSGRNLWDMRLSYNSGNTDLVLRDALSATNYTWAASVNGDDTWQNFSTYWDGSTQMWVKNGGNGIGVGGFGDWSKTRFLVFGGSCPTWQTVGKQTACPDVSIAGIASSASSVLDDYARTQPLQTVDALLRALEIIQTYGGVTAGSSGSGATNVTRTATAGRTALDCLDELATTVGANAYVSYPSDAVIFQMWDVAKPRTSSLTVTLGADDDVTRGKLTLTRDVALKPTRVTVSSAFGSATIIDAVTETGPPVVRREETVSSCAASVTAAYAIAGARLNRSGATRFSLVPFDLVSAQNDLYAAVLGLRPGHRITLASLPSTKVGVTARDAYVAGWEERWGQQSATFSITCTPVTPEEAVLDDTVLSRVAAGGTMTVTSGTAVGSTGNGTLVITTSSGPTLTTDAAAYPLDLDWSGERVTITSAPAGSASPQTVTTTARGVSPTVSRSHAAGEPVDVYNVPTIAGV